jgi:peptide/nickel transport system ATP-binding protein
MISPIGAQFEHLPITSSRTVMHSAEPALTVDNLQTYLYTRSGIVKAVDGVSFALKHRETVAIVGESGCGKTMVALSLMRLVPDPPGRIVGGVIRLDGKDIGTLGEEQMRMLRGSAISMIFQEPMTALNPVMTIGTQIAEAIRMHEKIPKRAAFAKAVEMLHRVRIPEPIARASAYPHQVSGGVRQRVMIAMALACNPKVLVADEPTTALDVTIQAQIIALMQDLQEQLGTAILLITHDLGVVSETADRVIVMYGGRKVEEAEVNELFDRPLHPYTRGLIGSVPRRSGTRSGEISGVGHKATRLQEIPGVVPALSDLPPGCHFAPRCPFADDQCRAEYPPYEQQRPEHWAACWHITRR